ncbi:hypothetical protein [Falsiroseomonas sp. E2-1-a4]|uniref:hypothetical protein n=1 Tax=Falsiroseomonas sp. E2-1-a4 TaxID=3239299 RepID=UPI003F301D9F
MLILDGPKEGIQPSVIKDTARVIRHMAKDRGVAVKLLKQIAVMVRGEAALAGAAGPLDQTAVRKPPTV